MKIEIEFGEDVIIECYSKEDDRVYKVRVSADNYGRLSFINLN